MQMPEIEREEILSQRLEELQKIQDKKAISRMARMGTRGEADSVSKAAKRPCCTTYLVFPCLTF